jgi:hypothetical protein
LAALQEVPAASQAMRVSMATAAAVALPVMAAQAARVLMAAQVLTDPARALQV